MARRERAPRRVLYAFWIAMLAAMGFAATYVLGFDTKVLGVLLAASFGALAFGLAAWSKLISKREGEFAEERVRMPSPPEQQDAAYRTLTDQPVPRSKVLWGMLGMTVGTIGVAAAFPVRSLYWGNATPRETLVDTAWTPGRMIVDEEGKPVRLDDLEEGTVLTVFPEFYDKDKFVRAATLLLRVDPSRLQLPPDRMKWVLDGVLAYSKVCTHAGCPVGLFPDQLGLLMCPCHHSFFDVYRGAQPVSGPAVRPLPQLPIALNRRGYLIALGDYTAPPGPGWWDYP